MGKRFLRRNSGAARHVSGNNSHVVSSAAAEVPVHVHEILTLILLPGFLLPGQNVLPDKMDVMRISINPSECKSRKRARDRKPNGAIGTVLVV